MAKDLKDTWKETGKGLGYAFRDLGKSLVKTGATALKKADQWANKEDYVDEPEEDTQEEVSSEE